MHLFVQTELKRGEFASRFQREEDLTRLRELPDALQDLRKPARHVERRPLCGGFGIW